MKKQFKIGEYAVGGIIAVEILPKHVTINALEYHTKRPIPFCWESFKHDEVSDMDECLNRLTTSYHADKILTFIKQKMN